MRNALYVLLMLAAFGVGASFCIVILEEREQAFRTFLDDPDYELFGVSMGPSVLTEPGWYVRIPGLHKLYRYEHRRVAYRADPRDLYTAEKELIEVDYYAMWRIEDTRRFFERVRTYDKAISLIDDITFNEVREVMGRSPLRDLLSPRREELMRSISDAADETLQDLGIRIDDLRIRRTDYPEANRDRIFQRMRTERERFAKRHRAEGEEEARGIRSGAERESEIVRAEAARTADRVRGEGDAEAASVYAEAYGRDPEFYAFVRSLEAYERSLVDDTTMILSPESPFLRYLFSDGKPQQR